MTLYKVEFTCYKCNKDDVLYWMDKELSTGTMEQECKRCYHDKYNDSPCLTVNCKRKKCLKGLLSLRFTNKDWDTWWEEVLNLQT